MSIRLFSRSNYEYDDSTHYPGSIQGMLTHTLYHQSSRQGASEIKTLKQGRRGVTTYQFQDAEMALIPNEKLLSS